jgi:hypothetical protein
MKEPTDEQAIKAIGDWLVAEGQREHSPEADYGPGKKMTKQQHAKAYEQARTIALVESLIAQRRARG